MTPGVSKSLTRSAGAPTALQKLVPIVANTDRVDAALRDSGSLGFVKLHGCITRTHEIGLPLILATDSYATHRKNRQRLYGLFYEWAAENPIVFVGQAGQDLDLRSLLIDLDQEVPSRPLGYIVRPGVSRAEAQFWSQKRYEVLNLTFEDFLLELNQKIPQETRKLAVLIKAEIPIERRFVKHERIGSDLEQYLQEDVVHVHPAMPIEPGDAKRFFKGFDLGWYPIVNKLDVRRRLTDRLLLLCQVESEPCRHMSGLADAIAACRF
jgi:hypothetical protein